MTRPDHDNSSFDQFDDFEPYDDPDPQDDPDPYDEPDPYDQFDNWLDDVVRGESTPGDDAAADDNTAGSAQLRAAARQIHDLAAQSDRVTDDSATGDRLDRILEQVMMNTGAMTAGGGAGVRTGAAVSGNSRNGRTVPLLARHRWQGIVNTVVAAALILGLSVGVWLTFQGMNGGEGDDPGSVPVAGLTQGDSTPQTTDVFDPPSAEDCKVEPLTVDEVMAIVDNPAGKGYESEEQMRAQSTPPMNVANDKRGDQHNIPPSQEAVDAISAVHREWQACVLAGSYFQLWALSDPMLVFREVTGLLYPTYRTREEGRALLEELRDTGSAGNLGPPESRILLYDIDPDPTHSNQVGAGSIQLGWVRFDASGQVIDGESASYEAQKERCCANYGGGYFYEYWWNHEEGRWVIYDNDAGGRG
jgi:hypothetical protein